MSERESDGMGVAGITPEEARLRAEGLDGHSRRVPLVDKLAGVSPESAALPRPAAILSDDAEHLIWHAFEDAADMKRFPVGGDERIAYLVDEWHWHPKARPATVDEGYVYDVLTKRLYRRVAVSEARPDVEGGEG